MLWGLMSFVLKFLTWFSKIDIEMKAKSLNFLSAAVLIDYHELKTYFKEMSSINSKEFLYLVGNSFR